MKTLVSLLLFSLLLTACADSELSSIATQVHEGPIAEPEHLCFAALDLSDRITWVALDGGHRQSGPSVPQARSLAYDPNQRRLLATQPDVVLSIELGATEITEERQVVGIDRVWPLADGLLLAGELGRWTHERTSGETSSRTLPTPLSLWERNGFIEWLGVDHPRASGAVIVRTRAANPLLAPAVVYHPEFTQVMDNETRAAPYFGNVQPAPQEAADGIVIARIEDDNLVISGDYGEAQLASVAGQVSELMWLRDRVYLAVMEKPHLIVRVDTKANRFNRLANLKGPIAGPMPCPAMIPLP